MHEESFGNFLLHWAQPSAGTFTFAAEVQASGWVGVGFPSSPGQMVGAEAIQGSSSGGVRTVLLASKDPNQFQSIAISGMDSNSLGFSSENGMSGVLEFTRTTAAGFDPTSPVQMLGAYNSELSDWNQYHTGGRFGFELDLTQAAVGDTGEPPASTCKVVVPTYSQCAGVGVDAADLCCAAGDTCTYMNQWFSQCRPDESVTQAPAPGGSCSRQIETWGKCGGRDRSFKGTCCKDGDTCVYLDSWYSQCVPTAASRRMLRM